MSSNRTILHLTSMTSEKYGAFEHYLLEMGRRCRDRGYRTVLQYDALPRSEAYRRDLEEVGIGIVVLPVIQEPSRLRCVANAARFIARHRPEVLHVHFVNRDVLVAAPVLGWALGAKRVIFTVHTNPRFRKGQRIARFINNYTHVLGVSEAVCANLIEAGASAERVKTHYLGLFGDRERSVDLRARFRRELGIPEDAIVFACIAFDAHFKGLDVLLAAFQRVASGRFTHLVIVGTDPAVSELPRQAAALGIADRVHWPGLRDEGWELLNAADVYVQSSRYAEGLPFSVLEAMALRTPVVATRVSGVPEAVVDGETGLLTEPDSADRLAATMERMLASRDRWAAMGDAGHRRYRELFRGPPSVNRLIDRYYAL